MATAKNKKEIEMAQWEYTAIVMGAPDKKGRKWVIASPDPKIVVGKQVGEAEKPRFIGKIWQGARLLESALKEMDAEGWELVSHSFSGILAFYGTAVLRRPAGKVEKQAD